MAAELVDLSIAAAADMMADGEFSPFELVQAHLEQIEKYDSQVNAFITLDADAALESARKAEAQLRRSRSSEAGPLGTLFGIPMALKDLYETRDMRTTAGTTFLADWKPEQDAFTVQKLKAAGAIILGKLNMHEIALGVTNENPHYGDCCNPWNLEHITGGSSGGSAAALSARMCMGSMGSDTGGSIRIPASLCGVTGMKPTYGRVSLRGVVPLSWNLDHSGPMARDVRDTAILLQAVAGYDPEDPASVNVPVSDYLIGLDAGVSGLRVGLASGEFFSHASEEVLDAVIKAARVFEDLGSLVSEVPVSWAEEAAQANGKMVTSDAAAFHRQRLQEDPSAFGADVLERLQGGAALSSSDYVLARRTQTETRRKFDQLFEDYDLLLTPATPVTAPKRASAGAAQRAPQLTRFTAPFNLTGLPALVLPCGITPEGMPLGLQIAGPAWSEARLLRAGFAYEQAAGLGRLRPNLVQ